LTHFMRALEEEADLSALGRYATRWDVHRFLSNLARLRAEERRNPGILSEPIEAPIFITGLPRSGTTFLHRLLIADPTTQAPLCWQTIYPYPDTRWRPGEADNRARRVEAQLRFFSLLAPDIRDIHPLSSHSPQECTEITAHVFHSMRFDTTYNIPSYRRWLDDVGHAQAFGFHKTFLQHLQSQNGRRRWILKCPEHVFSVEALRQVYPDARFIFLHRDPLKVIQSVARLTEVLRQPFAVQVDCLGIGRQVLEDWVRGGAAMVTMDRNGLLPSNRVIHVPYADFVAHPLATVGRIYDRFGICLSTEAAEQMARLVARKARGGYGNNRYRLEPYGLIAEEVRDRFSQYAGHFDIRPETATPGGMAA